MANKRPKPEEIVTKLRPVEILTGQGVPRLDTIRQIGVTEQTYSRWEQGKIRFLDMDVTIRLALDCASGVCIVRPNHKGHTFSS